jgi:preprotein translocase subunit SecE
VARISKRSDESPLSDSEEEAPQGIVVARPEVDPDEELLEDEELDDGGSGGNGGPGGRRRRYGGDDDDDPDSGHGLPAGRSGHRRRSGLIGFVQGSWRELQRVQWPDQRQVVQATGVVLGFVIVAGAYLGLADWVATKIVNFIL